jgi:predicted phage terminase large subunit-like protein
VGWLASSQSRPRSRPERRRALSAIRADSRSREHARRYADRAARIIARADDLELIEAEAINRARASFWAFRCYIGGPKFLRGWWQEECADELQAFYEDMVAGKKPALLFEGPRQHGKTRQVVEFLAWVAGKNPDLRKLYASYSATLGKRANKDLQKVFASKRYKAVFPATRIQLTPQVLEGPEGEKLPPAARTQTLIEYPGHLGQFRNTTVLGSINGEGFDLGVLDDPLKGRTESHSEVKRETAWNWLSVDFLACMSNSAGLLVIAARRHKDDPVSRLRDLWGDDLRVISYPALAIKDEKHRAAGEPLFPELKDLKFLLRLQRSMPRADWAATMQQNPITDGGNVIEGAWFKDRWSTLPLLEYRAMFGDTAQKTKTANDYSVLLVAGKGRKEDPRLFILDILRGKWTAPQLKARTIAFWNKHNALEVVRMGRLRHLKIEDKASGTGLIQDLQSEGRIPVLPVPRDVDKYTRVCDVLSYIEAGLVVLPADAPWVHEFLVECEAFTSDDSHDFDDQVDCLCDAISEMLADFNDMKWGKMG